MTNAIIHVFTRTPEWWSAVGTVVNAVVVIVLAVFNYLYLRAANRQAKASEEQARETRQQLEIMIRTLHISTQANVEERRSAIVSAQSDLRRLSAFLNQVRNVVLDEGSDLTAIDTESLIPGRWNDVAACTAQEIAHGDRVAGLLHTKLLDIRADLRELVLSRTAMTLRFRRTKSRSDLLNLCEDAIQHSQWIDAELQKRLAADEFALKAEIPLG
jgi:hypothetical protein